MKKATINITGLGRIYAPDYCTGSTRDVYLCDSLENDGTPVNLEYKLASFAKTHYTNADKTEASGYYLRVVAPFVFILVSPDSK